MSAFGRKNGPAGMGRRRSAAVRRRPAHAGRWRGRCSAPARRRAVPTAAWQRACACPGYDPIVAADFARRRDRSSQRPDEFDAQRRIGSRRVRGQRPQDQGAGAPALARARRSRSRRHAQQGRAVGGIPPDHPRSAGRAKGHAQPPRAVRAGEGAGRRAARFRPARGAAERPRYFGHHGQRPPTRPTSRRRASCRSPRSASATNSTCSRSRNGS